MASTILWFRRNLRLGGNAALQQAIATGQSIVPIYVVDELDSGSASRWWLHHSLASLDADIAELGGQLIIASGDPGKVLPALAHEVDAQAVVSTRRLEPRAALQESQIRRALGADALELADDCLLNPPERIATLTGSAYKIFTPYYRAASAFNEPPLPEATPANVNWFAGPVDSLALADLELLPTSPDWAGGMRDYWEIGENAAHRRIDSMAENISDYALGRDLPAFDHTSGLSPHLHFGEISPAQVWHAIVNSARERGLEDAAEPFIRQLYWRDFSSDLFYHFPTLPESPLRDEFRAFPWTEDPAALQAWQRGQTGFPIVDAGMRQLWHIGWMHNRVRMIVASLLVKHLLIPWQSGANWFLDTLVDADLANNSAGWQWVAGCGTDAAPYFRIFNPIAQGKKFDPDGTYVRRWVPELRELPAQFIHEPWTADEFTKQTSGVRIGKDYPAPVIEHKRGRERALEADQLMRSATTA